MSNLSLDVMDRNLTRVNIGALVVWFSYDTPIAFDYHGEFMARENLWGPTTGKHLNRVGGIPQKRQIAVVFELALDNALRKAAQELTHAPSA